jgi:diguanylate cyclase (GGDEF)-like protein
LERDRCDESGRAIHLCYSRTLIVSGSPCNPGASATALTFAQPPDAMVRPGMPMDDTHRLHGLMARPRLPASALVVALVLLVGCFAAIAARTLWTMREGHWQLARQTAENITAAIEADIARNIEVYDLSLRNVVTNYLQVSAQDLPPAIRHQILFDHAATATHFGPLRVLGSDGSVLLESGRLLAAPALYRHADVFTAHLANPSLGLYVGTPQPDETGLYEVPLSRRIEDAEGRFAGVVVGSIKITYFHDLLRRLDVPDGDAMTVVTRAGVLIMRRPFDIGMLGKDLSKVPGVERSLHAPAGAVVGSGAIDPVQRLYVWTQGRQFNVVSGRAMERIFGPWRHEAITIGAIMAVLVALMLTITAILLREMKVRRAMQARLAELASTDALTGVANRRCFDMVLDDEWKRGARVRAPLALLMIDADHFKQFNDSHGHQAGDAALQLIAGSLRAVARRAGDCAARYGGEEFALILPNTTAEQACIVADRLRADVASRAAATSPGDITVSIGVAAAVPHRGRAPGALIEAADAALYRAKQAGRDRVACESLPELRMVG